MCVYVSVGVCACVCLHQGGQWSPCLLFSPSFHKHIQTTETDPGGICLYGDDERNGEVLFLLLQKHSLSPDVPWERVALALVKTVFIVTQNMFLQIIYFADI